MAASMISSDPSSSSPPPSLTTPRTNKCKYHVYLSFNGSDTRNNFVDHLHYRLTVAGIYTFKDDLSEDRGSSIQKELFWAILESRLSVVVLSREYASSVWCLEELVKIMGCRKEMGHMVVPIFYGFDPSEAGGVTGMYQQAFARHQEQFEEERVMKWREALTEAGDLPGWNLWGWDEATSIEHIVRDISDKLIAASSSYAGNLFGIASKIKEVEQLLSLESNDVRMVGIWGMGGIGKTTIAKVMYERISEQFGACCFLANVSEKFGKDGLASLERELLSKVLLDRKLNIRSKQQGSYLTKHILCNKKILLVLDDVSSREQLESLAGGPDWFGLGSRVIITTQDKQLLHSAVADIYEVSPLDHVSALPLFSWCTFGQNQPVSGYLDMSNAFISYAQGLPLALKALGFSLYNRSLPEWQSALDRLQSFSGTQSVKLLQAIFEGLTIEERGAYLDIACLFNGEDKDVIRSLLDVWGCLPDCAIGAFVDKAFAVTDNKLFVHDFTREMSRAIVLNESKEPHGRSRLWLAEDICYVLMEQRVSIKVEAISLDTSKTSKKVLPSWSFMNVPNLRLLRFFDSQSSGRSSNMHLPKGLHYLPQELRYLRWDAFPLESLPLNFLPTNLVELHLPFSKVKELWTRKQHVPNLKLIDLSHSDLTRIPELLEAKVLRRIHLKHCKNLVDVSSIQYLEKLEHLNLRGCVNLQKLPSTEGCTSLTTLNLSGCSNLRELPALSRNIEYLYLVGLPIEELHPSVKFLAGLIELDVSHCLKLRHIPVHICKFTSLEKVIVSGCQKLSTNELLKELQDGILQQETVYKDGMIKGMQNILHAFLDTETAEWLLLYTSLVMEGTSAAFEQLHHALLGMVMAVSGLLLCLIDLTIKAHKEQASLERRGYLPWFYSHRPHHKLFGTSTEYFGLAAAIWQVLHSSLGYLYARRKLQNPIQMTVIMFLFCLCQLIRKLINKYSKAAFPRASDMEFIVVQN